MASRITHILSHNNQSHADRQYTLFELMFGKSPLAIPLSFKNTKYPSIEERMGTLLQNSEETLAAHKLAMNHMMEQQKSTFVQFKKGDKV